ncbi:MAG: HEAT repeat domain-containing protein [SAR324 cluster bacterium]|nr:HEAT repeat domain-containing protein [SAR324 cluster bacterium]
MDKHQKQELLKLAKKKDVASLFICLSTLEKMEIEHGFREVLAQAINSLSHVEEKKVEMELFETLDRIAERLSRENYLQIIADISFKKYNNLSKILGKITELHKFDALVKIAGWSDVPKDLQYWLAEMAPLVPVDHKQKLADPFMRDLIATIEEDVHVREQQVLELLGKDPELIKTAEKTIAMKDTSDLVWFAGSLLLLGYSQKEQYISTIGPFLCNAGMGYHIIQQFLEEDKIQSIFSSIKSSGVEQHFLRCWMLSKSQNQDIAHVLAHDHEFKSAIIQFFSSNHSFLELVKQMFQWERPKKEDVSINLILRQAASIALGVIESQKTVEYLKVGMTDKNERVRNHCINALRERIGNEKTRELLNFKEIEISSLQENVKEGYDKFTKNIKDLGIFS